MNDLEKLKQTFTETKVEFEVVTAMKEQESETCTTKYQGDITWDTAIRLESGIGYYDFYCVLYFLKGVYQGHGVWE